MIRSKLRLVGLCAMVLGVMAISASAAKGALFEWKILNAAHTVATELKALLVGEKDSQDITLLEKVLGLKVALTCTNFELVGVNLEAAGTLTNGGKVKFTGCEAYGKGALEEALGCKIRTPGGAAGTIESKSEKGELILHEIKPGETELVIKIEPKEGTVLMTLLTEGCVLPESNPINGKLLLKDCQKVGETHLVKHLLEPGPLTSLWVGVDTVEHLETSIDGSLWIKLGGPHLGLEWAGKHNLP